MLSKRDFYIDGQWVSPTVENSLDVIDPSTQEACAVISVGTPKDVDNAVEAAKRAFPSWSGLAPEKRLQYVEKILQIYRRRSDEMAKTISMEMGAPIDLARDSQAAVGIRHIESFIETFKKFKFVRPLVEGAQNGRLAFDAIGVVGLITPWNWPMNQVTLKVIPALLAGCTMVFKPSEIAPLSSILFAEILEEAGIPKGVFNLVNGRGEDVGSHLSGHKDVEMISFTGSTRAGKAISKNAADSLKRVCLELGGKGANIVFADAADDAVEQGIRKCFVNSGQSCNAPTRMLVERSVYQKVLDAAKKAASATKVASGHQEGEHIGPVVSKAQYDKVQDLIQSGIDEGATLLVGGTGHPEGLDSGYFVKPTVFADVTQDMRIFKEEIFGPVLSIMPFDSEEEALEIANNSDYGLTHYIQSQDPERCTRIALKLRSGTVEVNGVAQPRGAFFGGVKHSGRAREGGQWGIEEFLDSKAISV